jgi:mono/diheme cytochrome c family protein
MKRSRFVPLAALLIALPVLWAFGGGWAVVTVEHLPEYAVAGQPLTLTFTVRQHGEEPMSGLKPRIEARNGTGEVSALAVPTAKAGQYVGSLVLPAAGYWRVRIGSELGRSGLSLKPLRAIASGDPAPAPLAEAERGEQLFVAKGCVACHTRAGIDGAEGKVGPELTGKRFEAAFLARFLANPASAGPPRYGNFPMPNLGLKQAEVAALAAFLNGPEQVGQR